MDTERLRRSLLHRNVLLLFAVLFVPQFFGGYLFPLVPPSLAVVVRPFVLLLSIPGKIVTVVGGVPLSDALWRLGIAPDGAVVIGVLFYLFAVVAAGIGCVLGRYAADPPRAMRLRYLLSGTLVLTGVLALVYVTRIPATCAPGGDCTFSGAGYRLFVLAIGVGLGGTGIGVVGVESLVRRFRTRSLQQ